MLNRQIFVVSVAHFFTRAMSFEKILIVEDDMVIRNLFTTIFARHKLPVSCAGSLAEASVHLAREPFDLVMQASGSKPYKRSMTPSLPMVHGS